MEYFLRYNKLTIILLWSYIFFSFFGCFFDPSGGLTIFPVIPGEFRFEWSNLKHGKSFSFTDEHVNSIFLRKNDGGYRRCHGFDGRRFGLQLFLGVCAADVRSLQSQKRFQWRCGSGGGQAEYTHTPIVVSIYIYTLVLHTHICVYTHVLNLNITIYIYTYIYVHICTYTALLPYICVF